MTIALVIKVYDGIVLAADSATTMMSAGQTANIYNNANKIFNLHKGLPVGSMTWGLGNIGPASIATLAKDVRQRFHGEVSALPEWKVDLDNYKIEDLAARVNEHLIDDRYESVFASVPASDRPLLGLVVAGYSSDDDKGHVHVLSAGAGSSTAPFEILAGQDSGAAWWGQPEAIARILNGFSLDTTNALVNLNVGLMQPQAEQLVIELKGQVAAQMVQEAMPIQDAIDLAEFLVHSTIQFVRFTPGDPTVGGPIEIATITRHEGFKWVKRKHYFDERINRGGYGGNAK